MPHKTKKRRQVYYLKNREREIENARRKTLWLTFGITPEGYAKRLREQNGVCAVCRRPETIVRKGRTQALAIDHDHSTGVIRGLLCSACNKAIGFLRDDPVLAYAVAAYLERASLVQTGS